MSDNVVTSASSGRRRVATTIIDAVRKRSQLAGLAGVLLALVIVFQIGNPIYLSAGNVLEVLRAATLYFIVACPMTLVIVSGGIDFSAGALFATGGVAAGFAMVSGVPWPLAVLFGIAAGGALGVVNGILTVYFRVPPLIATISMFFVASGVITVLTGGVSLSGFPKTFTDLGQGFLAGIPFLVFYAIAVGIIFWVVLEKTPLGYDARAVGGNRAAASANGIRVNRHDLIVYGLAGAVAALAGIMGAARLASAAPQAGGTAFTFQVVTAVIIGGTSLFGGIGGIGGSALGALLFASINNGLVVIGVNALWQNIFVGVILAGAVAIDQARRRRQFTSRR